MPWGALGETYRAGLWAGRDRCYHHRQQTTQPPEERSSPTPARFPLAGPKGGRTRGIANDPA
eukprot:8288765-Lingulodinium_polyedra.AAC.1